MSISPKKVALNDNKQETVSYGISPLSKEIVIGVVGYAGAGCSTVAKRLRNWLETAGYSVINIKLSELIAKQYPEDETPEVLEGLDEGKTKLSRACKLQDLGDSLRNEYGHHAVAALAVREIIAARGQKDPGREEIAFILDSLKHSEEVILLRKVYDTSFRLLAVHCERTKREARLVGKGTSVAKYGGADRKKVLGYVDRDEKDAKNKHGQQVRDAFYLADFFIDNTHGDSQGAHLNDDLERFADLLLGSGLVRPRRGERAIYHAYAASMQSSCLSRQVGACLVDNEGTIISTGTNDVPKFGGGIYDEDSNPDHRCFRWAWTDGELKFVGCHNQRKKVSWRTEVAHWMSENLSMAVSIAAYPETSGRLDTSSKARSEAIERIKRAFKDQENIMERLPGVKDILEFSRSIHAEMNALFSAARKGVPTESTILYTTTFPCHNCARHLVTAGVGRVYYIEPFVKSLAIELHSDSIALEPPVEEKGGASAKRSKMTILPFTGVGPRMYEDYFVKKGELKGPAGEYLPPAAGAPEYAVRLNNLTAVEEAAAALVPETGNG